MERWIFNRRMKRIASERVSAMNLKTGTSAWRQRSFWNQTQCKVFLAPRAPLLIQNSSKLLLSPDGFKKKTHMPMSHKLSLCALPRVSSGIINLQKLLSRKISSAGTQSLQSGCDYRCTEQTSLHWFIYSLLNINIVILLSNQTHIVSS